MSRPSYRVDSIHINVGAGDSAIHLLLQVSGSYTPPGSKTPISYDKNLGGIVLSAVLVDGGRGSVLSLDQYYLLQSIPKMYQLPGGDLQFDSIVLTHWDIDHYGGLWKTIKLNLDTESRAKADQCSFMKYADAKGRDHPLTTLYAPYWVYSQSKVPGQYKGYTSSQIGMTVPEGDSGRSPTEGFLTVGTYENVCNVKVGFENLIGRDFFGSQEKSGLKKGVSFSNIKNVDDLLAKDNRDQGVTRPGLYCVAADNQVIGFPEGRADQNPLGSKLNPFGVLEAPMGFVEELRPLPNVVDENHSESNRSSIICFVIWDENRPAGPGVGRIRHYSGGDAEWQNEVLVTRWTGTNGTTLRVPAMKLSHHGAATSTPLSMLTDFNPDTIIASCGHRYTHPRWEIVLYLYLKHRKRTLDQALYPPPPPPLLSMNYPAWLNGLWEAGKPPNMIALRRPSDFLTELRRLATSADGEIRKFLEAPETKTEEENREWIIEYLSNHWSEISRTPTDRVAFPSMTQAAKESILLKDKTCYNLVSTRESGHEATEYVWGTLPVPAPKSIMDDFAPAPPELAQLVVSVSSTPVQSIATTLISLNPSASASAGGLSSAGPISKERKVVEARKCTGGPYSRPPKPRVTLRTAQSICPTPSPPISATFVADPAGTSFRILSSSRWAAASKSAVAVFSSNADFDDFISVLDDGCITLTETPTGQELQAGTSIAEEDGWLYWMKSNGLNIRSMNVLATPTSTGDYNIGATSASLSLSQPVSASTQLVFTTDPSKSTFPDQSMRNPPSAGMSSNGYVEEFGLLIFGLDASATSLTSISLSQLMEFYDLEQKTVFGLAQDLRLILDRSASSRNAIWFLPVLNYRTDLRLQFTLDSSNGTPLQSMLDQIFQGAIGIKDPKVVLRKTVTRTEVTSAQTALIAAASTELIVSATFSSDSFDEVTGSIDFQPRAFAVELQWQDPSKKLDADKLFGWANSIVQRVTKTVGLPSFLSFIPKELLHAAETAGKAFSIRSIRFTVENTSTTPTPNLSLCQLKIIVEMDTSIGRQSESDGPTPALLTYVWPSNDFMGTITQYIPPGPSEPPKKLLPTFEPCRDITPYSPARSTSLKLSNLIPGISMGEPPQGLPNELEYLTVLVSPNEISFEGTITGDPERIQDVTCPPIVVEDVTLELSRITTSDSSSSQSMFSLTGYAVMKPRPPPGSTKQPDGHDARLEVIFSYNSEQWSVEGRVEALTMSHFYSWIEDGYQSSTLDLLDKIRVEYLLLSYDYAGMFGSKFRFEGEISFGQLVLELEYTYAKNAKQGVDWLFHAGLGAENVGKDTSNSPTLKSVIASICGQSVADNIPNCADFPIGTPDNPTSDMLDLRVEKTDKGDCVFFRLRVNLPDGIAFTFVQFQQKDTGGKQKAPKRVVRLSLAGLPSISGVPMVGTMTVPVDEIDYVWVHDESVEKAGLTYKEVSLLNQEVLNGRKEALRFEPHSKDQARDNDVVLEAGSHFIVVFKGSVILDYCFGRPEPGSSDILALALKDTKQGDQGPSGPTTKSPVKYTIGPLSVSNFGLKFHNNVLSVILDATLVAGPVSFEFLDLTISLDVSRANLHQLNSLVPSVSLNGMGIQIDTPPVIVMGLLHHQQSDAGDEWIGGLSVEVEPYSIMATGGFGTFHDQISGGTFHTLFVYGQWIGPLLDIDGIILVTGLRIGLGYNSTVTNPDLNSIFQFPLVSHDVGDVDPNPLAIMTAFCTPTNGIQWIVPKNDAYWFAVGIDALVFDMIGVSAILILADYSTIHVFAAATAILPPGSDPNKDHPFLWVEFGIISTEDLKTGNAVFLGQLSPNSYVLDPSCHLSGGFAMALWPAQNDFQQDDWVMTVGGYHTAYRVPPHYPVPDRLKISWQFDSCLSIYGEAYCAATPKSRQAGGLLKACFNAGPLGAHFDAWADFLINVDPFYFSGAVGVSVGVDFTLDLWICTIHVSCSIGADVYIHGPPFQGHVHVNFWVFGFDIWFGGGETTSDPLTFEQFWNMLAQGAGGDDPSKFDGPSNVNLLHTVQNGMVASKAKAKTARGGPWFVRGGTFTFRVESRFPITRVTCGPASITSKDDHIKAHDAFANPMHVSTAVQSDLDITIKGLFDGVFRLTAIVKDVPRAIWDPYDPAKDPVASHNNRISELMHGDDPTVKILLGASVTVPKPTIGDDGIPTFNVIDAMKEDVNPDLPNQGSGSGDPVLAVTPPVQAHWAPQTAGLKDIRDKWSKGDTSALQALTTEWESFFGWSTGDAALKSVLPTGLLEGYENNCMAVPKIAVG